MRLLVVGAGASYAEAVAAGLSEDLRPPLIANFAAALWTDYSPRGLLANYLIENGYAPGSDPLACFLELERADAQRVNVERFFEYAFREGQEAAPGEEHFSPASPYDNLIYHGVLRPLSFLLVQGLLKEIPPQPLSLAQTVARALRPGDVVVNLNYDTLFEIGLEQLGMQFAFLPNRAPEGGVGIAKPHGSFNLMVNTERRSFWFGMPLFTGDVQGGDGFVNYAGVIPPRYNKSFAQHPVAATILRSIEGVRPDVVTLWGVGLTDSDADILALYRGWCEAAARVEFINPSQEAAVRAAALIGRPLLQFKDVTPWRQGEGQLIAPK